MVLLIAGTSFSGYGVFLDFPCHEACITGCESARPSWSSWALAEVVASSSRSLLFFGFGLVLSFALIPH